MTSTTRRPSLLREAIGEVVHGRQWVYGLPLVILAVIQIDPLHVKYACGAVLAAAIVTLVVRAPVRGLMSLLAVLPFHTVILTALYRIGVPLEIVKPLAYWKELIVVGIAVAAWRKARREEHRLDRLDKLVGLYLAFVLAYFLFPRLLVPVTRVYSLGAPIDFTVRSQAVRLDSVLMILLVAVRHLRLERAVLDRLAQVLLRVAVIVCVVAVFEYMATASFDRFVLETLQYNRYRADALNVVSYTKDIHLYGFVGSHQFLRVGSVFLNALTLGFYLVLPFAICVERLTRSVRASTAVAVALIGAVLVLTQTRSALLAAIIVVLVATQRLPGRTRTGRVRFALFAAAVVIIAVPFASATGLSARVSGATTGSDESASSHFESTQRGVRILFGQPFGRGLGTSPGIGARYSVDGRVTSENYYLQVGNELGVWTMVAFIMVTITAVRAARRASRNQRGSPLPAAAAGAIFGLAIGAFFLQIWNDFPNAWTAWAMVGAAIGGSERLEGSADDEDLDEDDNGRARTAPSADRITLARRLDLEPS